MSSAAHRPYPLRLRGAARHFTWDNNSLWAWYVLTPSRWSFLTDDERTTILGSQANGWAELAGRRVQLRVTHRPYSGAQWARRLDVDSPDQISRDGFVDMVRETREQMRRMSTAEAIHYLGVEVGPRSILDRITGELPQDLYRRLDVRFHLADRDRRRLGADVARVTQVVNASLKGRSAEPQEIDFLISQSRALGCTPGRPSPNRAAAAATDMFAYTDGVQIDEHPMEPHLTIRDTRDDTRDATRYVTVLTLGRVDRIAWPPQHLPLLAISNSLGFPVEVNVTGRLLDGRAAQRGIDRQLVRVTSEIAAYTEVGQAAPPTLTNRKDHALSIGTDLENPVPAESARWQGHVRFAVSGANPQEVADRVQQLKDVYLQHHIPLHREPQSRELAAEFVPHEPVGSRAYDRQMPVKMVAVFLPQVTSAIGDQSGVLIGTTVSGPRRPVLVHPQAGPEIHERPGLIPIVGGLGSGKSYLAGLIAEQTVVRGIGATVLDPSAGAFTRIANTAELRDHSRIIDLVHGVPGSLSPWAVVAEPRADHYDTAQEYRDAVQVAARERMVLAEDVCRALLPADLGGDRVLRLALTEAIAEVGGDPDCSLHQVVDALAVKGDVPQAAARFLKRMADYPRANLFFDTSEKREVIDEPLVVVTFSGLVLPHAGADKSTWTTDEQLSVPLLNLATTLTFRRVARKPRAERHTLILDELGILQGFPSFRSAFTRISADSRKLNTAVYQLAQDPRTIVDMNLLPYVGSAFVGVTDDNTAAAAALEVLGLRPEPRYAQVLRDLPRPGSDGVQLGYRDFVYRDNGGRVERIRVNGDHRPGLAAVLDTTPRQKQNHLNNIEQEEA